MLSILDPESPQMLIFPTGIVQHDSDNKQHSSSNKFLISYHENDINIKLLQVNRAYIDSMLIYNEQSTPESIEFKVIEQKSVVKNKNKQPRRNIVAKAKKN